MTSGECLQTPEVHFRGVESVCPKNASGSYKEVKLWITPRGLQRRKEMACLMLSLRRANRRKRDQSSNPLPSEAGRRLYNPDIGKKIGSYLKDD